MNHFSYVRRGDYVGFPEWRGERHYMLPFTIQTRLPERVSRFQCTVDQMMKGVDVSARQECYLMVDEMEVATGLCHRRPGLHADGYWIPELKCHGGSPARHSPVPYEPVNPTPPKPKEPDPPPPPDPSYYDGRQKPKKATQGLLIASNHTAARAFIGHYERDFLGDWRGGECFDLSTQGMTEVTLLAGVAYHLDVFTLHESLPVQDEVRRTLVRINVPNWSL
jgi:hypothetical protein